VSEVARQRHRGRESPGVAGSQRDPRRSALREETGRQAPCTSRPKLNGAPSNAPATGVGSPQGGRTPHGRTRRRSGKHPAVGAAKVTRPDIERTVGARVTRGLQRSVRSILSVPSRGAARRTEAMRGSPTRRRLHPDEGRHRARRATRVREYRANFQRGIASSRSAERPRSDPTEGVLGSGTASPLTGWRRSGSWCRGQAES
jgi:hypothetical protein